MSLNYQTLHDSFRRQDAADRLAAALQSRAKSFPSEFRRVFDRFAEFGPIAMVGSSLKDISTANDINLLFPSTTDFRKLAKGTWRAIHG